ncbi:MAG: chromosome partitioning protein ParA [Magnetococcales bacterium]|nr:chromosome partitioning protein ParA [Magnetococcales bacterium]
MSTAELLLNWVDVARRLWMVSHGTDAESDRLSPPKGVVFAQTFWDRLLVGVAPNTELKDVWGWLSRLFGPRWIHHADDGNAILLEAQGESLNRLPVEVEELDADEVGEWRKVPFHPRFTPLRTARFSREQEPPPADLLPDHPPILAFHSFKGGVGRTLCALATTLAYTAHHKKVLLVDADFEAPGISFLFEKRMPDPDFAMADLLTMIHADPDPKGDNALASAKKGIAGQRLGDVYILPCFRHLQDSVSLEIRPEHLVASTVHPPFFLSDILSRLGKELGVDVVIVDLRAGLSDLSSPIILDPRIKRILVANASGQSIRGTQFLIQEIGKVLKNNQWPVGNLPALILNQLPGTMMPKKGESGGDERFNAILESINKTLEQAFPQQSELTKDDGTTTTTEQPLILTSAEEGIAKAYLSYNEPLAALSDEWEDAMETIRDSLIPNKLWESLQLWLPIKSEPVSSVATSTDETLDERRQRLCAFADKLVTAEGTSEGATKDMDFLPILPLTNLANDHTSKLPIVVSIGAKGAGKTYSYLNIARSGRWNAFVKKISDDRCEISAFILPVLWSKNADQQEMQSTQESCRKHANFQKHLKLELYRELSGFTSDDLYEWRDFWANAIAKSLIDPEDSCQPYESLIKHLQGGTRQIIAVFDGLEEAFPQFAKDSRQQTALRALLQELPNWLRTLPGMPLGLIIFVRQDMVLHAIPQNRTQFTDKFKSYALRWTWQEALELAAWVSDKSTATKNLWDQKFAKLSEADRSTCLKPLWGYKLGGDESNEAVSNNWVLSVLSDLRGRIQGRDVVRFLSLAAKESVRNTKSTDRLLAPAAMRAAIQQCSQKKVEEIGEENAPLKEVFDKIKDRTSAKSQGALLSPCTYDDLGSLGLKREQVELLEENGIIFLDPGEQKYHFPEIFRHGLNVERAAGARPKVVSLLRQARNQGR